METSERDMNKGDEKQKAVTRRRFFLITWGSLLAGTLLSILSSIRFLFPNILTSRNLKWK
jgi:hypothetical protein